MISFEVQDKTGATTATTFPANDFAGLVSKLADIKGTDERVYVSYDVLGEYLSENEAIAEKLDQRDAADVLINDIRTWGTEKDIKVFSRRVKQDGTEVGIRFGAK